MDRRELLGLLGVGAAGLMANGDRTRWRRRSSEPGKIMSTTTRARRTSEGHGRMIGGLQRGRSPLPGELKKEKSSIASTMPGCMS